MAPPRKHDEATRHRVAEMYQQAVKMKDIEAATGVPRATIYLILNEMGVGPQRSPSPGRLAKEPGAQGIQFVMERLMETHEELVVLRGQLEACQQQLAARDAEVARLKDRLKAAAR